MWHTFLDLSQTLSTLTVASAAMERHVILGSSSVISGGAGIEPLGSHEPKEINQIFTKLECDIANYRNTTL